MLSDGSIQDMVFLMLHRDTRELLAAASFFMEDRARQDGLMLAVRAGEAKQLTKIRTNDFTRSELRTLKNKVAAYTHRWEDSGRKTHLDQAHSVWHGAGHAAIPGHPALSRMQHTPGAKRGSEWAGTETTLWNIWRGKRRWKSKSMLRVTGKWSRKAASATDWLRREHLANAQRQKWLFRVVSFA